MSRLLLRAATLAPGDEVYGFTGGVAGLQGSHAQYLAVDALLLAHKPANLTMREAAVLPLVVITAWEGLIDRAQIRPGQSVLVLGGGGGVGHVAVQIALAHGARVHATAFAHDHAYLRGLGAVPVDAARPVEDFIAEHTGGAGFDVVYDTGGGAMLDAAFKAVRQMGHVVSCLGWGTHPLADEGRAHFGRILEAAAALAEGGQLLPRLDPRNFTLAEVAAAYDAVLGRNGAERQRGKIAISVA